VPAALRVGRCAARVLRSGVRTGYVASTFGHGALLRIDAKARPVLIVIQAPEAAFHPWAVEVEGVPAAPVKTPVAAGPERIRWGDVTIELAGARIESLEIEPYTAGQAHVARGRISLIEANAIRNADDSPEDPFKASILRILDERATFADPEALARLVGLGGGSTPAGDDVLVGLLAGLRASEGSLDRRCALSCAVRIGLERTTLASAQMLEAALDGAFPEPLRTLVHALGDPTIDDEGILAEVQAVRRLGASSGRCMLLGVREGLSAP